MAQILQLTGKLSYGVKESGGTKNLYDIVIDPEWKKGTGSNGWGLFSNAIISMDAHAFYENELKNLASWMNGFARLAKVKHLDVTNFVIPENITSLQTMFGFCTELLDLDFTGWGTSHITNFSNMFSNCTALRKVWAPSTFVATAASAGPFSAAAPNTDGTHVYTDATSAEAVGWGTIGSNWTVHYGATHEDYENA